MAMAANQTPGVIVYGHPVIPPPASPATRQSQFSDSEKKKIDVGFIGVLLTSLLLLTLIELLDDHPPYHAQFTVESITVSPFNLSSVSLWNVKFQAKSPSWRCRVYYDRDVSARLSRIDDNDNEELLYGAVLNATGHHSSFSVDFAAARSKDRNAVVSEVFNMDFKVSGRIKYIMQKDRAGHHTVQCRNLTVGFSPDSMEGTMIGQKKKCKSTFFGLLQPL